MEFKIFKQQQQNHFQSLLKDSTHLFITDLDKDLIWNTYFDSYPIESKQEHNCNCCRQFLRPYGNVVAIKNNKITTIWDFECAEPFKTVVKNLHNLVINSKVENVFISKFQKLGTDYNHENTDNGVIKWEHFFLELPKSFVDKSNDSIETVMAKYRDSKNVFKRSLDELTLDSVETVLELIEQNSLYRGEEFKGILTAFKNYIVEYNKLQTDEKDNYCWISSIKAGDALSRIRNSAIGTLLIDISEGKDLDRDVAAFDKVMCPTNYKRPTAIITKAQIEKAEKRIVELGLENSLGRRHANINDIRINNVLFANRDSKKAMNVFEQLKNEVAVNVKNLNKIEEISIEEFIKTILPKTTNIEVLLENQHVNNLMNVIAPINSDSKSMLKWKDNFTWSYNNDVTDSIKEKVRAAGGKVDAELRVSLSWYNYDDLDLHVIEPNGNEIYFRNLKSTTSGELDVDMNAGSGQSRKAVENIVFTNKIKMLEGRYKVIVNNYTKRERIDNGCEVEIECDGNIFNFVYDKSIENKDNVYVTEFDYNKKEGVKIIKSIESKTSNKNVWNINTNSYNKVSLMMLSPNHWDEQEIGNKHYFFILENCRNENNPRGFYNEFLNEELMKDKHVFEALGNKMRVESSNEQLAGLGFSSTNTNSIICKVDSNNISRNLIINFKTK